MSGVLIAEDVFVEGCSPSGGVIAVWTLNRPEKLNAMTALMGAEMGDVMAEADADDSVRAVVLTGAGRAFCAGADLGAGDGFAAGWGGVERSIAA